MKSILTSARVSISECSNELIYPDVCKKNHLVIFLTRNGNLLEYLNSGAFMFNNDMKETQYLTTQSRVVNIYRGKYCLHSTKDDIQKH